jgi:chemotaxis signal transduction protein
VTKGSRLAQRVLDLQVAFDQAFASRPSARSEETEDLLLVRIGGDPYALRSREMTGLSTGKKIAPLPSGRPELVGIVGIRGSLLPVFSLAVLLGYGAHPASSRWLAFSRGAAPLGLAFQEFEGFARARSADMHAADGVSARRHVRAVARFGEVARPIVDIASTIEVITLRAGAAGSSKEG